MAPVILGKSMDRCRSRPRQPLVLSEHWLTGRSRWNRQASAPQYQFRHELVRALVRSTTTRAYPASNDADFVTGAAFP